MIGCGWQQQQQQQSKSAENITSDIPDVKRNGFPLVNPIIKPITLNPKKIPPTMAHQFLHLHPLPPAIKAPHFRQTIFVSGISNCYYIYNLNLIFF